MFSENKAVIYTPEVYKSFGLAPNPNLPQEAEPEAKPKQEEETASFPPRTEHWYQNLWLAIRMLGENEIQH